MANLNFNTDTLLLVFVGITALAFVIQALILLGVLLAIRKGTKAIREEMEDLRSSVTPLIAATQKLLNQVGPGIEAVVANTRQLIINVSPKIESTMADLSGIAGNLREESEKLSETTLEIMEKVRTQSNRINQMLTDLLDSLNRAGEFVVDAVNKPIRQMQGIIASVRAAVDTLNSPVPPRRPNGRNQNPYA